MRHGREIADHVGRVMNIVEGRSRPAQTDPAYERLARSWRRSLNKHSIDPGLSSVPKVVTAYELREHRERIETFMRIAREGVERLHHELLPANYCVLLTDATGVTVDYRTVPALEKEFKDEGFRNGTCWAEEHEGTCGVGTTLADRQPTLVHRGEHFRSHNTQFTCSSAPILGLQDEPIAVLDASALYSPDARESQLLVFRMVCDKARLIEDAYAHYSLRTYWTLQLGQVAEFMPVETDYLIAFDDDGRIVGGNRRARQELINHNGRHAEFLHDLFECTASDIMVSAHASPGTPFPLRMMATGRRLFAVLRAPNARSLAQVTQAKPVITADDVTAPRGFRHLALGDPRVKANVACAVKVANRDIPVMLLGETGTGKEAFARAIHDFSDRAKQPFVALNCAAIPESLIESELFGYRDGAFTGARSKGAKGKILQSDGGTLFLDEIGDMPLSLQSRLLRVLAEGEVVPLGAEQPTPVNLHVVCATHQDLPELVRQGRFREDLFYRLNGASFMLPPLRNREDKRELIQLVLREECAAMGREELRIPEETMSRLLSYDWPGNIRQLRHAIRYACAIADGTQVTIEHFPQELRTNNHSPRVALQPPPQQQIPQPAQQQTPAIASPHPAAPRSVGSAVPDPCELRDGEPLNEACLQLRQKMLDALRRNHWRVTETARQLGMSRATFYRKMARLRIVAPNYLDGEERMVENG
ncbi:sigma-54-dependent Fis family transcriptional regulator [Methyloversatilis discipulorum]|uniref:sigma-54-dependent Fis family transcriptional regulator n=1 Tax=Methyloversatilis discipulorum TaxID=1119528 RepID=UPI00045E5E70|nr:sigma-54-dependent Fis family transcriptional regulator [Methyloversatilis discipulorum]